MMSLSFILIKLQILYYIFSYIQSSTEAVLGAEFHPYEKNSLVTCGKSQLAFWTFEGGALSKKQGIFEVWHFSPFFSICFVSAYMNFPDTFCVFSFNMNTFVYNFD